MSSEHNASAIGPFDIHRVMAMLPHRYPFLLVDRVVSVEPGKNIYAYKNVSMNEPFFQGHFPDMPVMPGVLILEALAQAAGLLVLFERQDLISPDNLFMFTGLEKVRFRKPVVPGDKLELRCELVRHKLSLWKMQGLATVDGNLVAEAEMTAAIMPKARM